MTAATVAHATPSQQTSAPCVHGPWKYAGRSLVPRAGSACEAPGLLVCMACGECVAVDCKTTRSRKCEPCGLAYRHNVQRIARVEGELLMWTLTAPGRRAHSTKTAGGAWVRCPCTSKGGTDIARWNAGAAMRFSRLLNNGVRRDPRFAWLRGAYFRVAEVQQRGALHFHVLVRVRSGTVIPAGALDDLTAEAIAYGFGHECDVQEIDTAKGAWYVAKYVSKSADAREMVPWAKDKSRRLEATPVPVPTHEAARLAHVGEDRMTSARWLDERVVTWVSKQPTYKTWSKSDDWPNSMKALREAQEHFAALLWVLPSWEDGALPDDLHTWLRLPDRPDGPRPDE